MAVHPVRVISVDLINREVTASWNSNAPRVFSEVQVSRWKAKKPEIGVLMRVTL